MKSGTCARIACAAAVVVALFAGAGAQAKTFKVALGDAQGSAQAALGEKFVEELEARTDGKHKAELFYNGQLGTEQATVNDAAMGVLDFSIVAINNITPFSPTVGIFTLPYVILSLDEAVKLTQGEVGKELTENTIRDAGVRILGWSYTGFRRLTNSKRPVKTLEDLQGLVIRVPKNEIMIETYKAWGINPTPMAWSETFTALQQGVVDGQDNPYLTINAMKFYEVQDYVTNIRYIFSLEPLIISEVPVSEPRCGNAESDDRGRPGGDRIQRPVPARPGGQHQGDAGGKGHGDRRSGRRREAMDRESDRGGVAGILR